MLHHRAFAASLPLLLALAACSSSNSGGNTNGDASTGTDSGSSGTGPTRKTVTCADIATAEAANGTYTAGSWGDVPTGLQTLPSGAILCGSTSKTLPGETKPSANTHITSTAWDQDIFSFYNPLVTKLGCTLKAMDTSTDSIATYSRTSFTCTDGAFGTISATDETQYIVTYAAASK